ncbi:MAG: DUF4270 domain-containing protein [Prevotella sp.]|nr:DUF4270 domain-containing protein [Prevotella sp.]
MSLKTLNVMAAAALMQVAISSCENDDLNIGQSLTSESDKLTVTTATYNVTTRTIMADSVLSLSADCYFGRVRDPETGADVTSEFTTQFHLLETTYIAPADKIIGRDAEGRAAADSCDIVLYLDAPAAQDDSLTAMKMRTSELATPLEEGLRYYSNYSPLRAGIIRQGGVSKGQMFSYANLGETDDERTSDNYMPVIRITMNQPYTAPNGEQYSNYGSYVMNQYYDHPEYFRNSYLFTHNVCPGFFFQITDGLGFHSKVSNIGLRLFYRAQGDTSIVNGRLVLAGTREVLQTTHVTNDEAALRAMAAETQHTYLKTPAGLFTEVTLPISDIKQGHDGDSLLSAKLTFQRLNNQSSDNRLLPPPKALLLVQKDSLKSYFESASVPDNIKSYYTTAATTNNTYTFANLSSLVTTLWQTRQQGIASDPNWEANHPNWNKMVLVPITYTTSTSSTTPTSVHHDMSLTSTRLVGGPDNPREPLQISIVYAKFR